MVTVFYGHTCGGTTYRYPAWRVEVDELWDMGFFESQKDAERFAWLYARQTGTRVKVEKKILADDLWYYPEVPPASK